MASSSTAKETSLSGSCPIHGEKMNEKVLPAYEPSVDTSRDEVRAGYVQEFAPAGEGVELYPRPTDDVLDPLNWPRAQKWTSLGIVMWM